MRLWFKTITLTVFFAFFSNNALSDDTQLKNRISDKVDELEYLRDELAMKAKLALDKGGKYTEACEVIQRNSVKMSTQTGWKIRQPTKKPRNPAHKELSDAEKAAFEKFKATPRLGAFWLRDESGFWYFRQITIETKCLACHGPAAKRPAEIKQNYPNDRGYGFNDGDFYGVFSVLVGDKKSNKKAKAQPVQKEAIDKEPVEANDSEAMEAIDKETVEGNDNETIESIETQPEDAPEEE